jgi:hypothetical protein
MGNVIGMLPAGFILEFVVSLLNYCRHDFPWGERPDCSVRFGLRLVSEEKTAR